MAGTAEGHKPYRDKRTGIYYVRFSYNGKRHCITMRTRDPAEAAKRSAQIYAEVVSGRCRPRAIARAAAVKKAIDEAVAEWLAAIEGGYDEDTIEIWTCYGRHFIAFFPTLGHLTDSGAEDYILHRLRCVLRVSLIKELTALRSFTRWCEGVGYIDEAPTIKNPPKRKLGTLDKTRPHKRRPVELDEEQTKAIIEELPEYSRSRRKKLRFAVRARFEFAYETGLRPSTIDKIRVPEDYRRGAEHLQIRDEIDKARFGRELPLSTAARAALDRVAPDDGLIFGRHDDRRYVKEAAQKIDLPPHLAKQVSPYDFRRARGTHLCERTSNLAGVAYLLGHTQVTTTNRYVHPGKRAAAAVLDAVADADANELWMDNGWEEQRRPARRDRRSRSRNEKRPAVSTTWGWCEGGDLNPYNQVVTSTSS